MFRIDPLSRQPVYEQLIEQLEKLVLTGLLSADSQLPSVRSLSLELSINPNTIQKAYSDLDLRGIIYSVPGIGSFVSRNAAEILQAHMRRKLDQLRQLADALALAGIPEKDLTDCIHTAYKERGVSL